jgi:hypothetical protein
MKLLLIDNSVKYEQLVNARKDDVDYIIFDAFEETYNSLLDKIVDRNVTYTDIALIQHASKSLEFIILQKEDIATVNDEYPYPSFNPFKQFLVNLKKLVGVERLDLLGCLLYRNIKIHDIVKYLEDATGIDLRASTNFTGNPDNPNTIINENGVEVNIGADWIMESDNIDIRENYFTDYISNFKDILYTFIYNYPVNDKYSGTGVNSSGTMCIIDALSDVYYIGRNNSIVFGPTLTTAPNVLYTAIDISEVIPNYQSYSVIDKSNNVWCWGASYTGGNDSPSPTQFSIPGGVRGVYSTNYVYSAIDFSNNVWVWGNPSYGGVSPTPTQLRIDSSSGPYLTNISSVLANGSAFCAIGTNGNVWVWGSSGSGGSNVNGYATQLRIDNATTGPILSNIVKVYCVNGYAGTSSFLHLDTSGNAYVNGQSDLGGNGVSYATPYVTKVSGITGITTVVAIQDRYSVMDASGKVWLLSSTTSSPVTVSSVQLSGITAIYTSNIAFYAISGSNIYRWATTATATLMTGPSTISKVVTNDEAIAIIDSGGNVFISGTNLKGGNNSTTSFTSLGLTGIINVYYVRTAFAAVNAAGNVWIWGEQYAGGNNSGIPTQQRIDNSSTGTILSGIISIANAEKYHYAGRINAFVALHSSGNVYTWGNGYYSNGANYASLLKDISGTAITGITNLYCNYASFIGKTNGGLYTWGTPNFGALAVSAYKLPNVSNAKKIYSNQFSYAIIDNSFNTWVLGIASYGGSSNSIITPVQILSGIKIMYIYANYNNSFLAVSDARRGYIWSTSTSITTLTLSSTTNYIIQVNTNYSSFAILDSLSNVWILGTSGLGGNGSFTTPTQLSISNITNIYSAQNAFAAVDTSKNVWIWGASGQGGNGSNTPSQLRINDATTGTILTNIVNIYSTLNVSNNGAFIALDASGYAYVWGSSGNGGNGQDYASLLTYSAGNPVKNIKSITVTGYSFAALDASGYAWLFGSLSNGGSGTGFATKLRNPTNTADLTNIVEIGSMMNNLIYRDQYGYVYNNIGSTTSTQLPVSNITKMYTAAFAHLLVDNNNRVYTSALSMESEQNYGSLLRYEKRLTGTIFDMGDTIVTSNKYYFVIRNRSNEIYVCGYDTQITNIGFNAAAKPLFMPNSINRLASRVINTLENSIYTLSQSIFTDDTATIINNTDGGSGVYTYTYTCVDLKINLTTDNNIFKLTNTNLVKYNATPVTINVSISDRYYQNTSSSITLYLYGGYGVPLIGLLNPKDITIPYNSSQEVGIFVSKGLSPYTYKWYTNINSPLQIISNTTTTTLYYTINNTSLQRDNTLVTYYIDVSDSDPTTAVTTSQYNITFSGYGDPSANYLSVSSATIPLNSSLQLGLSVSGGLSPYTYKWYTDINNPLQTTLNTATTTSYYTINNANLFRNTTTLTYYCDISDSGTPVKSTQLPFNITLIGYGIPSITLLNPNQITIYPNFTEQIGISISGGLPQYTYKWYNDTTNTLLSETTTLSTTSNISLTNNSSYSTATTIVYRVDVTDSGVTTPVQTAYYSIIYVAKSLTTTITTTLGPRLELPFDQSTTLTAIAEGGAEPYRYTWYSIIGASETPLYNTELVNISGNTLTITNNRQYRLPTTIGYKCVVHNA